MVIARWLLPLQLPLDAKLTCAALLLAASQFHLWSRISSGSVFDPELPRAVIILFNWAFGAILLLAVFQILLDIGTLIAMAARGSALHAPDWTGYAVAGVAALLAGLGVWNALRVPPLKDVEVTVAGLPRQFDGYRLIQLTDLHLSRLYPARWARAVVERANAADADLIVVTGDFIDGPVIARYVDVVPLAGLRARDGVYAIPGNHEYFFGYPDWMRHLTTLGIRMLPNAHAVLTRNGGQLVLAGVTDVSAASVGQAPPDVAKALEGVPVDAPILLLDHQPRNARRSAAMGVALQLSGHTHGGMIKGLDRFVARANGGFVSGRYAVDGMTLYVSNGTALWPGFALRLGVPSELTRFTLRAP